MIKLSVITPVWKEPYLNKCISSLIENSALGDQLEIIPVLDGCWQDVMKDDRVRVVHLGKNVGMREAINSGVKVSRGECIMRLDAHCDFAPGYDKEITDTIQENWVMTAKRYFLDPEKWEVMDKEPVVYEKLKIRDMGEGVFKFEGVNWRQREREREDIPIDETMAMQGSMWVMRRAWWDKVIGEFDYKRYGKMLQDSHEMQFKTWKAGGKLMVNKNTWFAHKHVSFPRTHNHPKKDYEQGLINMYNDYKDYYEEVRKKWNV